MSLKRIFFWSVAVFLLVEDARMQIDAGSSGDKNWLLLASRLWLGGRTLGVDLIEVNPPLIIWFFALPVWLTRFFPGVPDFHILIWIGLGLTLLCAFLGTRLIARHPAFAGDARKQADFCLLLLITLMFFNTPVYFFDRDHITFVLIFPYILRFMPSVARQKIPFTLQLPVGLLAALGFCIKPHCLLVLGVLQLLYIVRERSLDVIWRLENLLIYAGWAAYVFCVWKFAPAYLNVVMPMALETYSYFNRRINGLLFMALAFVSAGLTFVEFRPRYATPYRAEVYYFLGACFGFMLYALSNNGWGYTYNLLLCMLLFMSGWMLWDYGWLKREHKAQGKPTRQFAFGQGGCIVNLSLNAVYMLACLGTFFLWNNCAHSDECRENDFFTSYVRKNDIHSFSTLSMDLRRWTAIVRYTGASWGSRFNNLWMLPGLLHDGPKPAPKRQWILDYVGKGYGEDLAKWKPDVVFVDVSDAIFGYPHPVDIPGYFSQVPEFKAAWARYRYVSTVDNCVDMGKDNVDTDCRYAVYRRTP